MNKFLTKEQLEGKFNSTTIKILGKVLRLEKVVIRDKEDKMLNNSAGLKVFGILNLGVNLPTEESFAKIKAVRKSFVEKMPKWSSFVNVEKAKGFVRNMQQSTHSANEMKKEPTTA